MADNTTVKDAAGATVTLATSEAGGIHTQHTLVTGTVAVSGPLTDTQLRATPVPVSGTFYQATQPVSGTFWQTTQPVSIAANVPVTPGTSATWVAQTGATAHVAAARTTLIDLFNATGSGLVLKVRAIYIVPALAAVTGVGQTYEIIRTSAVGTGGSSITPVAYDTASSALHANVTARTKPTGGATTATTLLYRNGSSEETTPYAGLASQINHVAGFDVPGCEPIVLRANEGLKVDQTTNSNVGNVNVVIVFTV